MKYKSLPLSFARCLLRMQEGEVLNASDFHSVGILKQFCDDGVLSKIPWGSRRYKYRCKEIGLLEDYLRVQHGIFSIAQYIILQEEGTSDGEASLGATKSTKTLRRRSLQGFFIQAYDTEVRISGKLLSEPVEGVSHFIYDYNQLNITREAVVVGVENPECFIKFSRLRVNFPYKEMVVVMRYMSISPVRWLSTIKNRYIHFGDYDPAGVSIYCHEYLFRLGEDRCSFYIPDDIATKMAYYGDTRLYDKQSAMEIDRGRLGGALLELLRLMDRLGKGMEQERMLSMEG